MAWREYFFFLPLNIWVGCVTAFLAALLDVARQNLAWRDKLMVIALGVGMAGGLIEWFLLKSAPLTCFTTGLIIGRSADSFMKSIDETMPAFSRDVVQDVQGIVRTKLSKFNDFRQPENTPEPIDETESESEITEETPPATQNLLPKSSKPRKRRRKRR